MLKIRAGSKNFEAKYTRVYSDWLGFLFFSFMSALALENDIGPLLRFIGNNCVYLKRVSWFTVAQI